METLCKDKVKEIVDLLNDPDETVLIKEVKEKLEKIVELSSNPEKVEMQKKASEEKLEEVVGLVNHAMANPDVEVEYCTLAGSPCIHLKYMSNGTHVMEQNIPIKPHYLTKTAEDISNLVTFYIEQFIEQIDSVENGAQ